ncbi:CDP-diacylglycerol--glycerol-3-phosphate 3-phosphatidyltransferase [Millisia brevis]|uniref:CDP-diacylglycerol--glycerol-3-phosphate 3-phosphatidyltransferase n=1 Tax=Millisia brevis TaxID=264148 RepID=UPI00082AA16E
MTSENQASMSRPFEGDDPATHRAPLWNIANVLTVVRLILVPVFVVTLLIDDGQNSAWRLTAAGIFLLAALTDRLDGMLARRYHLITDFGKLADPIADKALIGAGLIGLSILGELWWWVTIVILLRELGITVARLALAQRVVLPAGRGGKVKTLLQVVAILLLLVFPTGPAAILGIVTMAAAVVVTVATGIDYAISMVRVARR